MDARPATPPPVNWATLTVATCNTLNLALPGRVFYDNQEPYGLDEYRRKTGWLGQQLRRLNADVLALQEVWDLAALKDVVADSGLSYSHVLAPGAELGATGTPRVALVTRLALESLHSHADFPPVAVVDVPELGPHARFERPVLHAVLRSKQGLRLHVLVAHLKSKRPKFLQDASGEALEDRDDPGVAARATLRSLVMRAAEACALRTLVVGLLHRTREPVLLLGDLNDSPHAVTTQMVAATGAVAYDRQARDTALFHAYDVQSEPGLRRDVAYSHVYQGWPETLDQIWVSEEFVASSRFALGDVRRVEYFNDHLHEGRDRTRSDHGFVRALLRVRLGE
ncbi:endonuclease/exonuclease/phosphatase family protein [Aquabacterium sp. A7-Y]|uniref:endonuclease/exonuclease/phosphatase family protein n=1 Tax=Aquabacterium sp. A7-Y TaxID=1349605 RepID=UPI00223CEF12|nr:endonuclease/exonuclease/phosphatase family protein [Aquabacterium sp. A7-Y]MCW7537657.1 endonuclease/exonuclease/phosphatase family protein [Aquabacterium sp. A7-Y]